MCTVENLSGVDKIRLGVFLFDLEKLCKVIILTIEQILDCVQIDFEVRELEKVLIN